MNRAKGERSDSRGDNCDGDEGVERRWRTRGSGMNALVEVGEEVCVGESRRFKTSCNPEAGGGELSNPALHGRGPQGTTGLLTTPQLVPGGGGAKQSRLRSWGSRVTQDKRYRVYTRAKTEPRRGVLIKIECKLHSNFKFSSSRIKR